MTSGHRRAKELQLLAARASWRHGQTAEAPRTSAADRGSKSLKTATVRGRSGTGQEQPEPLLQEVPGGLFTALCLRKPPRDAGRSPEAASPQKQLPPRNRARPGNRVASRRGCRGQQGSDTPAEPNRQVCDLTLSTPTGARSGFASDRRRPPRTDRGCRGRGPRTGPPRLRPGPRRAGVTSRRGQLHSRCPGGSGSSGVTSSAAKPRRPASSASARAPVVDQARPADVHQPRRRLHPPQPLRTEQPAGVLGARQRGRRRSPPRAASGRPRRAAPPAAPPAAAVRRLGGVRR